MEERLHFEVGPLDFITLFVCTPVAVIVLGESEFTEHLDVSLSLTLLLLAQFCLLGSLECILPLSRVFVGSDKTSQIAASQVFILD